MKNFELKFYEKIGIKKFRKFIVKIFYIATVPMFILFKIPKEQRKKQFYNIPSNYFMKKGNGLKDLKDFKKWLLFNAAIHIYALIPCISGLLSGLFIVSIPCLIINLYCIMLQRYNYIRIDNTIKKYKETEKNKINSIKEELKENIEEPVIKVYTYNKKISEDDKNFDSLLDKL